MILYNLRKTSDGFMLAKFGPDFNVEAVYHLQPIKDHLSSQYGQVNYACDCPAGGRPSCKHRKMLARMIPKADSDEFYCYETQSWHKPLAPAGVEPMQDKLDAFYATVEEVTSEASSEPTEPDLFIKGYLTDQVEAGWRVDPETGKVHNPTAESTTTNQPPTFRRRV